MTLQQLVNDFAWGLQAADKTCPEAGSARRKYRPGIGPHKEIDVIEYVLAALQGRGEGLYLTARQEVPYTNSAERCDLCLGVAPNWEWALEIKPARAMRDNGSPEPTHVTKILSPHAIDRSALTDAVKIQHAGLGQRNAILIYAYNYPFYPMAELYQAFQALLPLRVSVKGHATAPFSGLRHPHHQEGAVWAWEVGH